MKGSQHFAAGLALFALTATAPAQQNVAATEKQLLNPLAEMKTSALKSFSGRPLFSPSRRPPEALEGKSDLQPKAIVETDPQFVLLGITSGPDGSIARIAGGRETTSRSLRNGESIDGWKIEAIDTSTVTMKKEGETKMLTIFGKRTSDFQGFDDAVKDTDSPGPGIVFGTEEPGDAPEVRIIKPN